MRYGREAVYLCRAGAAGAVTAGVGGRFEDGQSTREVARELRVHKRSVSRWRSAWFQGDSFGEPVVANQGGGGDSDGGREVVGSTLVAPV
ncbi:helix-turn-helix domain-containing protein [Nonomuraea wenchangensis]|uniref:helix-turn-helix domain-containing protein n=1 Tax=Nonomuraea wenchangensis TaxID=568860 RepID=UPI000B899A54